MVPAWLRSFVSKRRRPAAVWSRRRPSLEVLEDRTLLSFGPASNFATATNPQSVVLADFNGDRRPDAATANNTAVATEKVSVLLNNGSGGFGAPTNLESTAPAFAIAAGDFDENSTQDLVVVNGDVSATNGDVYLGNGNGTFVTNLGAFFTGGSEPRSIAVGDFDKDNHLDLAVANRGSDNVGILLGDGAGFFGAAGPAVGVGAQPTSVATADFNRDGNPDVAVANAGSNNVSILLGNGLGGFVLINNFPAGTAPSAVAVGDFNRDGNPDLAVANKNGGNVSILLGNGNGTFGPPTNFAVGLGPSSVAVADVNGDGNQDLAVSNTTGNSVSILLGNGNGTFTAAGTLAVGANPMSIAAADLDGSGRPDVVTANSDTNNISVLLNTTALAVTVTSIGVGVNQPFSGTVATFTTGNAALGTANFTATIDWGDGTTTAGSVNAPSNGDGTFTVSGSHTYTSAGTFALKVTVNDPTDRISATGTGTATVTAPAPPEVDPLDAWVRAVYRKVLNRVGDAAGIAFWLGQLRAGMTRFQVAFAIETFPERRGLDVDQFYRLILGRTPDAAGRAGWVDALVSGRLSESQVVAALFTSAEYTASHPDAASFVQGVFQAVLLRTPDGSEVNFYAPFAQGESGRSQVVFVILGSQEAFTTAIQDVYREVLGRGADALGLQFWLGVMTQGRVTPPAFAAGFYASEEFVALAPGIAGICRFPTWGQTSGSALLWADPEVCPHVGESLLTG